MTFQAGDLYADDLSWLRRYRDCNKLVIDPPRSGAMEVVRDVVPEIRPERIVYVSCNPATLARDAGLLVHREGYRMLSAGVMDMFPHTAHVESMAVFERRNQRRIVSVGPAGSCECRPFVPAASRMNSLPRVPHTAGVVPDRRRSEARGRGFSREWACRYSPALVPAASRMNSLPQVSPTARGSPERVAKLVGAASAANRAATRRRR